MAKENQENSIFRFDARHDGMAIVNDVEIAASSAGFFDEAFLQAFESDAVQTELEEYLRVSPEETSTLQMQRRGFLDNLDETIVSEVLLEVLQSDVVARRDYLDVLTRLTDLAGRLVARGRFDETLNIYNTLYPHTLGGEFQREASSTIEFFFRSEAFVGAFLAALPVWGRQDRDAATKLARALKPQIIAPLVASALKTSDNALRKLYLAILVEFRGDILDEIVKRLDGSDPEEMRTLLYLFRKCGTRDKLDRVKKLLDHSDSRVSTAAARTLLHFRDFGAVPHLKLLLQGGNEELRGEGIDLASTYRVGQVVPELLELLDAKDVFGGLIDRKRDVVRALGRIGDPAAVGAFLRIVHSKGLLRRAQLEELKVEIYRNLKNYPLQEVEALLKLGIKTNEKGEIYLISKELLRSLYASRQKGSHA